MYKKKPSEKDNQCPICDGIIWGKGQKVLIEGAKITVCQSCAQYGKRIITKTKSNFIKRSYNNKTITSKRGLASKTKNFPESSIEIVHSKSHYANPLHISIHFLCIKNLIDFSKDFHLLNQAGK